MLRRLVQRLAVAEAAKRRRRLQATLLFLFNGISVANNAVGPFLLSLCGVPGDGLFDLEEGVVGEGAKGSLQPLDTPCLNLQLVLQPFPQPFLLLEASQVKV